MTPKNLLIIARILTLTALCTFPGYALCKVVGKYFTLKVDETRKRHFYDTILHTNQAPIAPLEIQSKFLQLSDLTIHYKLPDLRTTLLYHGNNQRPDSTSHEPHILFSLRGDPQLYSIQPKEKIGLISQTPNKTNSTFISTSSTSKWAVAENNPLNKSKFGLTISFIPNSMNSITVQVEYTPPENQKIEIEAAKGLQQFSLPLSPLPTARIDSKKWQIGEIPVDITLLEKQKASWFGKDLFIELLGDQEFDEKKGDERVQFGSGEEAYVLWIKKGAAFVFIDGKWVEKKIGPETEGKELLIIDSISEKQIGMTLWKDDGSQRIPIQLTKRDIGYSPSFNSSLKEGKNPASDIKIVGAKTQNKWIAEISGARSILTPFDWIFFPVNGEKPSIVSSSAFIPRYIDGKENGFLLAFQGIKRIQNDSYFVGILFNPTRTQAMPIHISLYRSWKKEAKNEVEKPPLQKQPPSFETDDEEDDFEEDEEDEFLEEELQAEQN